MFVLLMALDLAGCQTTSTGDTKSAPPLPSATIAAPTQAPSHRAATPTPGKRIKNTPGDFDFYVMSLSWSPDYCASNDDPQQCSVGKKLGFVLHGLWPQYNRGYPADCSTVKLPQDAQQKFPNLYPSSKLYTHEWDKHGTCSGLKPLEFLALSKSLKDSIAIPTPYRGPAKAFRTTGDDLKAAFVAANPPLSEDALAVQCSGSGRFLQELYVCFSRAGQPVACSAELQKDEASSCRNADFLVRNVK
jgi:ribonuclease T2